MPSHSPLQESAVAPYSARQRVLEVLFSFRVGGSEVVGLELAQQLARAGAEVLCTALDGVDGPLREQCARFDIPVIDLGLPIRNVLGRNGLSLRLANRLRELQLDAIHLQHFLALNKLGLPARIAGVPRIVVTEHSEAQLRDSVAGRLRLRLNWRLAHQITVIHPGLREYLRADIGIPPERVTVIPNGIDTQRWHRSDRDERRAALGIGSEFVFLFVGRVEPVKDVPGLIRAFLQASPRFTKPAKLVVVGDGSEMSICRALLEEHPVRERVVLAGEQSDTRAFFAAADAFVMNSRSEGTPRALVEAMCMGLPAICTAVGGIPELLDGRGWLIQSGDRLSLESALLDAVADEEKGVQFGVRAKHFIQARYDYREIVRQYQDVLGLGASLAVGRHA
jgi:glycosyltransferase involved in cell wall biosynthesis